MKILIDQFCERKGMSRKELAEQLGVTPAVICNYAKSKNYPTVNNIKQLISLGITIEELFGEEYGKKIRENSSSFFYSKNPDFQQGVKEVLARLMNDNKEL